MFNVLLIKQDKQRLTLVLLVFKKKHITHILFIKLIIVKFKFQIFFLYTQNTVFWQKLKRRGPQVPTCLFPSVK